MSLAILLSNACATTEPDEATSTGELLPILHSAICVGKETARYDPPLTNTPTLNTATVDVLLGTASPDVGACIVVGATFTGATRHSTRDAVRSCQLVLSEGNATHTYLWNNGLTSTIRWSIARVTEVQAETVIVRLGSVTSGFGFGHSAQATTVLLNTDLLACSTTGIDEISGVITVEILPLL